MIIPAAPAIERISEDRARRVDAGPNGFMCWRRVRSFPDFIPEDSPYAYHYEQGGYTRDRAVAEQWLAGDDVTAQLSVTGGSTEELTLTRADACWPHLAPHREIEP